MSRGPGRIQRWLLDNLPEEGLVDLSEVAGLIDADLTDEEKRSALRYIVGRGSKPRESRYTRWAGISAEWGFTPTRSQYESTRRAARKLEAAGLLRVRASMVGRPVVETPLTPEARLVAQVKELMGIAYFYGEDDIFWDWGMEKARRIWAEVKGEPVEQEDPQERWDALVNAGRAL